MKDTKIVTLKDISMTSPILIEGLPGVGHVGKLVAEHLITELDAEKIVEIYSPHFPPQVLVQPDGTIKQVNNEVYAYQDENLELLIIIGDHQSATNEGHYEMTGIFLDLAKKFNVSRIYTLGGYGVGHLIEDYVVLGAVNNPDLIDEMKEAGIVFRENEPGGGIVGASGLLLGLGGMQGIDAACLMGVTSGYLVDPKSAQAVLEVLQKLLNIKVSTEALKNRAIEMERIVAKLQEMEQIRLPHEVARDEDLSYIG